NVIDLHVRQICQVRGSKYGAQDFLDGEKREKFQADFRTELGKVCKAENVIVRSAFIRNIIIPDRFLAEKREQRLAVETKMTALTEAEVAEAQKGIGAREAEVQAETARMVAVVERETANVKQLVEADIDRLVAEYGAQIAELEAERKKVLGEAEAEASKLKE